MEKRRPTYDLEAIKQTMASKSMVPMTRTAIRDSLAVGFSQSDVAQTIATLQRGMFVKSMTTFADHRVWQDVYHVPAKGIVIYLKFQADILMEFSVVSFKEK